MRTVLSRKMKEVNAQLPLIGSSETYVDDTLPFAPKPDSHGNFMLLLTVCLFSTLWITICYIMEVQNVIS